jgi:hypothetical protein
MEVVKRDMFRWLIASGIPFAKTLDPSLHRIFAIKISGISAYTGISRQNFNTLFDEDYTGFTHFVGTKLRECEYHYLGMRFVGVNHHIFQGPGGNHYLGASCSFIHDFYLHILYLHLAFNNKTHGSEHNAEVL